MQGAVVAVTKRLENQVLRGLWQGPGSVEKQLSEGHSGDTLENPHVNRMVPDTESDWCYWVWE